MIKHQLGDARSLTLALLPGILFCLVVVFAAHHISEHYGSPLILTTVLLGMAFNNIIKHHDFKPGLDCTATTILRVGVALLGIRITFEQIGSLGTLPLLLVMAAVAGTLLFSLSVGKLLKVDTPMSLLAGIAVAICGVSAAMALLAILPARRLATSQVACTLMGVTCISTLAMILYPAFITKLGMPADAMGLFLGTTIHDVAQAIGAGEMISPAVSEAAIYTKMLRVSLLVPVLMLVSFVINKDSASGTSLLQRCPLFLLAFVVILLANNLFTLPPTLTSGMGSLSQFCQLMAMAALGTRTNLLDLLTIDKKPLTLVLLNTLFIAALSFLIITQS